ncbi:AAEL003432-PA [Aedes aegypti]|uniref:AAEL003432-PA n=1 Tax=Aedes aegypti TaxID=7159 RepID=Q17FI2_AEDAE|nr:AAEL003432-PA [Aedes aegypti]
MTTARPNGSSTDLEQSEIFTCVACDNPEVADDLVACDKCDKWWHFSCAGVSESISSRDWICPRCRPPSVPASFRSTTSSKIADLQRKRLAEQQELEKKELELERKQLELQKRHSQEQYELEESIVGAEGDNRSVLSRVNEIEARERQVEAWVDQHSSTGLASAVPPADSLNLYRQLSHDAGIDIPSNKVGHVPDPPFQLPIATEPASEVGKPFADNSVLRTLQQQLAQGGQQPLSAEQLLSLEAQLRKCRLEMMQQEEEASGGDTLTNPHQDTAASKGARSKISIVRNALEPPKISIVSSNQTRLTESGIPDQSHRSSTLLAQANEPTGTSRTGPRIHFAPKRNAVKPPLIESTRIEQTRSRHAQSIPPPPNSTLQPTGPYFELDATATRFNTALHEDRRHNSTENGAFSKATVNVGGSMRLGDSSFAIPNPGATSFVQPPNPTGLPVNFNLGTGFLNRQPPAVNHEPVNVRRPSPEQLAARQVMP